MYPETGPVWPTERSLRRGERLSWIGLTDRYHAVVLHPMLDPSSSSAEDRLLVARRRGLDRVVLNPYADKGDTVMVLTTESATIELEPGASRTLTHGVYAGPRTKPIFLD